MSEEKTRKDTLTDEDMVTSPKLSRRMLIAGTGAALVTAALGGHSAFADSHGESKNEGDAEKDESDTGDMEKDEAEKDESEKGDMEKDEADTPEDERDSD